MAQGPDLVVPLGAQMRIIMAINNTSVSAINVLGCIKVGATVINQALANTLATAVRANFTTHLAPLMPAGSALGSIGIRDVSAPGQTEYIGTGGSVAGSATGDALPGGAAVCVSLKTALSGPRHRGRVYISGWAETSNTTSGAIDPATNTAAVAFVTAVQTTLASNGLTLAVISRPSYAKQTQVTVVLPGGATDVATRSEPARPGEINAVTSISARNTIWDSQRRRHGAGSQSSVFVPPAAFAYLDENTGSWVTVEAFSAEGQRAARAGR